MAKTGHLGFVAAHPLGLVNWTINAFAMGAQAMNPKAEVRAVFTGAWDDPVKERAADTAMIDQGAEVLGQQIDTPTTQIVGPGARGLRHRAQSRLERIRPQGHAVLIGVGVGPLLHSRAEEDRGRQLDA